MIVLVAVTVNSDVRSAIASVSGVWWSTETSVSSGEKEMPVTVWLPAAPPAIRTVRRIAPGEMSVSNRPPRLKKCYIGTRNLRCLASRVNRTVERSSYPRMSLGSMDWAASALMRGIVG